MPVQRLYVSEPDVDLQTDHGFTDRFRQLTDLQTDHGFTDRFRQLTDLRTDHRFTDRFRLLQFYRQIIERRGIKDGQETGCITYP